MPILIVEDEPKIADALRVGLEAARFEVAVATTGSEGLRRALAAAYRLIVLDLSLPELDGLALLATLRRARVNTPVIILTARDAVEDRVAGLEGGGDDYLVKPFAFPELLARVRALLRRGRAEPTCKYQVRDLEVEPLRRVVSHGGKPIDLTLREFELLDYLLQHKNQIVSREMLARDIWRETARASTLDNIIDVHVSRLRRKLDALGPALIRTVRGVGFTVTDDCG